METVPRETELSPWFVTGLIEGLGTFTFSRRFGDRLDLYFAIKVPGRDRHLLEGVQAFLSVGRIYDVKPARKEKRVADTPSPSEGAHSESLAPPDVTASRIYYRVHRKHELEAIVAHLDRYPLQGAKKELYRLWREIATRVSRPFRQINWSEVMDLARELSDASPRRRSRGAS